MNAPGCPEHNNLVLQLARGWLDDRRAEEAETVRIECAVCTRWWNEAFSGEACDVVDGAVAEAISNFVPPKRRRYVVLVTAAAVVLAVGIGTTSFLWRDTQEPPVPSSDVLSTWDFEPGTFDEAVVGAADVTGAGVDSNGETTVFVGDFETGDLSGWSTDS
jgi:hypothetical protein